MTNHYLQEDKNDQSGCYSRSSVLIVIDTNQQPTDLQDGISKIISYAPHKNLVDENAMNEETSEFKWHLEYKKKKKRRSNLILKRIHKALSMKAT